VFAQARPEEILSWVFVIRLFCLQLWYLPAQDVTMTTAASRWRRISASAHQVSASPSGNILWRLWKGSVFVACKVTVKQPYGQKWEEIARKASHIAVDEHMAW
jgi:hypothetical protein